MTAGFPSLLATDRHSRSTSPRCPVRECTTYRHIQVSPIAGALGAEVQGVDLARPLAPEVVGEIRQALLAHLVIFFPRQQLGPAELLAFAERVRKRGQDP